MGSTVRKFFTCFSTNDENRRETRPTTKKSPCCKGSSSDSPYPNHSDSPYSPPSVNVSPSNQHNFLPTFLADGDGQLIVDDHCVILEPNPHWDCRDEQITLEQNTPMVGQARSDDSRSQPPPPPYERDTNLNRRYSPPPAYFEAIMGNPQVGNPV
uniref:Uncharacterized protein n=1 Tax=Romanomermis culicivorax TaxID=13658 RepID=A0A915I8E3_ROMCU